MADKVVTLVQDKTGDNIYPNIKKENLPIDLYTTAQRQALNSGITSEKVAQYDTYEKSKVNKADVGSVVTNLIQQKEGGILSIAGAVLTNADGKLIKGPISQDVYSKDKVDELVGSIGVQVILEMNENNQITYTRNQYNELFKANSPAFICQVPVEGLKLLIAEDSRVVSSMEGDVCIQDTYSNIEIDSEKISVDKYSLVLTNPTTESNTITAEPSSFVGYFIKELNTTVTPKVLQCVGSVMSWVELPKVKRYFNHDVRIMFNSSPLIINIVNESNMPIDSITDLKTACGSRTQVMMTGVFRDDNVIRIVTLYNPQTNKIWVTTSDGTGNFITEILLASSANYTLEDIVDDVTLL